MWKRACSIEEIRPGEAFRLECKPPVAIFNVAGELFATADTCTHAQSSLAEGYIEGDTVECGYHFAKFCVKTGQVISPPAFVSLKTYSVKVESGQVLVDLADGMST